MKKVFFRLRKLSYYSFFIILAIVLVVFLAVYHLHKIFNLAETNFTKNLTLHTDNLSKSIGDDMDYIAYQMEFINKQIVHYPNDLQKIHLLLSSFQTNQKVNITTTWNMFAWADASHHIVVHGDMGILHQPRDISSHTYTPATIKFPWKTHFGIPRFGEVSKQWIIPVAMGVSNKEGNYLGALVFGFNLNSLIKKMESISNAEPIYFALVDQNFNLVTQSPQTVLFSQKAILSQLKTAWDGGYSQKLLSRQTFLNKDNYIYFQRLEHHPFFLVTTYDKNYVQKEFQHIFLSYNIEWLAIIGLVFLVIVLFHQHFSRSTRLLSSVVSSLAKGKTVKEMPRSAFKETNHLSLCLLQLQRYMKKGKKVLITLEKEKIKAEQGITIAREAQAAREDFSRTMRIEAKKPLYSIIEQAHQCMNEEYGPLPRMYKTMAENIFHSAFHMDYLTTYTLNCSYIDTSHVIKGCLALHQDKAYFENVAYTADIPKHLPSIYVDELRFRQILAGIIFHSLMFTPEGERIHIRAQIKKEKNKPKFLVITVNDTGMGASEILRQNMVDGEEKEKRVPDGTDSTLENIRFLVDLHKGKLVINSKLQEGSVFTLTLPYLEQDKSDPATPEASYDNVIPLFKKR